MESLVREFLARFPAERIQELAEEFERARQSEQRLKSLSLSGSRDELVTYSDVIDERGGVREGVTEHSFFFVFEGREFLVEDHYCANPECDCRQGASGVLGAGPRSLSADVASPSDSS